MKLTARSALRSVHDAVRTQLWPLPILGVVVAAVTGVLIPHLDMAVDAHLPGWLDAVAFGGDGGAARTVLSAVAGSLITVTSLTFSLTVVTLQLASSQFSPRLLRTFTQDIFVQITLAIFLAAFTYSMTVLRLVRSGDTGGEAFVPRIAVSLSFLLAIASIVALVLFLAHLTRQIRVETMLHAVHEDATETLANNLQPYDAADPDSAADEQAPDEAETVWAWRSGFLLRIDQEELIGDAQTAGLQIAVNRFPGEFVVAGTPLASIWSPAEQSPSAQVREKFIKALRKSIHFGQERTAAQDIGYGLRQLVDVANKALSPGINDPTTGIHAIGHIAALVAEIADHQLGPLVLRDDDDTVRAIINRPEFAHFLNLAMTQPRSYGEADSQVLISLYELLRDVAWRARSEHEQPLRDQLSRLSETARDQDFDDAIVAQLENGHQVVEHVLATRRRLRGADPAAEQPRHQPIA